MGSIQNFRRYNAKMVQIAHSMLQILTADKISRMDIIIDDESCFYWLYEQTKF